MRHLITFILTIILSYIVIAEIDDMLEAILTFLIFRALILDIVGYE